VAALAVTRPGCHGAATTGTFFMVRLGAPWARHAQANASPGATAEAIRTLRNSGNACAF
jgi:hypothetical protein